MSSKICTGYTSLPQQAIIIEELRFNGRVIDPRMLEDVTVDVSRTWVPSVKSKASIKYRIDETLFRDRVPRVDGDEFYIQLRAVCQPTKSQFVAPKEKLLNTGILELEFEEFSIAEFFTLFIEVFVIIQNELVDRPTGAAMKSYSVLAEIPIHFGIYGQESQVNVYASDFSQTTFQDALWDIHIELPDEIDLWATLDQSEVVTIRVNRNLEIKLLEDANLLTLLLSDLAAICLSKFMDNEEAYDLLNSETKGASWLSFVRDFASEVFAEEVAKQNHWKNNKQEVMRKIQSKANSLVNRAHKKVVAVGALDD